MNRSDYDVKYRGRRRWNGSYGKVWCNGELIFEIQKYECKVTSNREDVTCDISEDSKIVSLKGEGTLTIKSVINRNIAAVLEEWKSGHDPRFQMTALIDDPDAIDGQKERVVIDNVWFNELQLMTFEKGKVVEKDLPFGFTPQDAQFMETVE